MLSFPLTCEKQEKKKFRDYFDRRLLGREERRVEGERRGGIGRAERGGGRRLGAELGEEGQSE